MKSISQLTLGLLAISVLAACSSGGSSHTATTSTTTSVVTTPTTPTPTTPVTAQKYNGEYIKKTSQNNTKSSFNSDNLKEIVIDGQKVAVDLSSYGMTVGTWTRLNGGLSLNGQVFNDGTSATCCGKYQYTKVGYYNPKNSDNNYYFHVGELSKDVPTTGKVTYTGDFLYKQNAKDQNYIIGTSTYQADFANKKFTGDLSQGSLAIKMDGAISGNKITGLATANDKSTAQVSGGFYGPQAAELGGVMQGNTWNGVFAGKK